MHFTGVILLSICVTMVGASLVGGNMNQDPSNPEYMEKVWAAVPSLNNPASNNGNFYHVPIKVVSAQTQVVAGTKYTFEVLTGESSCKKGDLAVAEISSSNCQYKEGGNRALYRVVLWEKPWENFAQYEVEKVRDVAATEQL